MDRGKMPERVLTRDSLQKQDETVTMINQAICQEQRARLCANNVLLPTLRACSRLRDHQLDAFRTVGWCSSSAATRLPSLALASELLQFINLPRHYRNQLLSATTFPRHDTHCMYVCIFVNLIQILSSFSYSPSLSLSLSFSLIFMPIEESEGGKHIFTYKLKILFEYRTKQMTEIDSGRISP